MIMPNAILLQFDNGELYFEREESGNRVHPLDAAAKGFVVSPKAARVVVNKLQKAGVPLVQVVEEVFS